MEKPKSALVMAMQDNDPALANRLISQYGTSKHLCDRLNDSPARPGPLLVAVMAG
jgi:hypothetical protein